MWPSASLDLNLMDFLKRSLLVANFYFVALTGLSALKTLFQSLWTKISKETLCASFKDRQTSARELNV